jgi:NAD(P)-dependent dehydrogenase (short-subunit alcohol dehydrogenase family)
MTQSIVALITGSGRGLGRVMALALLKAGHHVVLTSTDQGTLNGVAAESHAGSSRVATIVANLGEPGEAERLAEEAVRPFGAIDILINNAGITHNAIRKDCLAHPVKFWEADRAWTQRFFAVNVIAPMLLAAMLAPKMVARGWGRIVNHTTSLDTMLHLTLYGGSKAALEAETAVQANSLVGTGVTANVLLPGGVTASRITDEIGLPRDSIFPDTIFSAPLVFIASDESNDFHARRLAAVRWRTDLPPKQAALMASEPIAWTGVGMPSVHPEAVTKSLHGN